MPCQCDYMEPNEREKQSQLVCKHLCYVNALLGISTPRRIRHASKDTYGDVDNVDQDTATLCGLIRGMTHTQREAIVYNAHDVDSRALAGWWEDHQEQDAKREKKKK